MAKADAVAQCRGCGADYKPRSKKHVYCSRACQSRGVGKKGGHGAGKKHPTFKHGFYSKIMLPTGKAALERDDKPDKGDSRALLEEQLDIVDALCAQVTDWAMREPAAIGAALKAAATRGEAAWRLASYDLRKAEEDNSLREIVVKIHDA